MERTNSFFRMVENQSKATFAKKGLHPAQASTSGESGSRQSPPQTLSDFSGFATQRSSATYQWTQR